MTGLCFFSITSVLEKQERKSIFLIVNSQVLYVKFLRVNIYLLMIHSYEIWNYSNDNTLSSWGEKLATFKKKFIFDTKNNLNWSRPSFLKANPGKFQIVIGDKSYHRHVLKIHLSKVEASDGARNYNWKRANL